MNVASYHLACGHVRLGPASGISVDGIAGHWKAGKWLCFECREVYPARARRLGRPTRFQGRTKITRRRFRQLQMSR